jgi:uncharacterized protein (TIGR02757 family)
MNKQKLKEILNSKVDLYNQPSFIGNDPISIPHLFLEKQDIEIAGLFAAIFSWGNRTTIINKSRELMERMKMQPYRFCVESKPADLKRLCGFKHRTFNEDDLFFFVDFLHRHYSKHTSLETAFFPSKGMQTEYGLNHFRTYFFEEEHEKRTEKHISSPLQGSACKRLNMYLRWMVRIDKKGVDFGIWKNVSPAHLICPLDVHVARTARFYGLIKRKQNDWLTAVELTSELRKLDPSDPVKYDFALFGAGIEGK